MFHYFQNKITNLMKKFFINRVFNKIYFYYQHPITKLYIKNDKYCTYYFYDGKAILIDHLNKQFDVYLMKTQGFLSQDFILMNKKFITNLKNYQLYEFEDNYKNRTLMEALLDLRKKTNYPISKIILSILSLSIGENENKIPENERNILWKIQDEFIKNRIDFPHIIFEKIRNYYPNILGVYNNIMLGIDDKPLLEDIVLIKYLSLYYDKLNYLYYENNQLLFMVNFIKPENFSYQFDNFKSLFYDNEEFFNHFFKIKDQKQTISYCGFIFYKANDDIKEYINKQVVLGIEDTVEISIKRNNIDNTNNVDNICLIKSGMTDTKQLIKHIDSLNPHNLLVELFFTHSHFRSFMFNAHVFYYFEFLNNIISKSDDPNIKNLIIQDNQKFFGNKSSYFNPNLFTELLDNNLNRYIRLVATKDNLLDNCEKINI